MDQSISQIKVTNKLAIFKICCSPIQRWLIEINHEGRIWEKPEIRISCYLRWTGNLILGLFQDVIMQHDRIKGPAFMSASHLLPHGCEEPLRVEKSRHPEDMRAAMEYPSWKLLISLNQLSEPETKRGWFPRNLFDENAGHYQSNQLVWVGGHWSIGLSR